MHIRPVVDVETAAGGGRDGGHALRWLLVNANHVAMDTRSGWRRRRRKGYEVAADEGRVCSGGGVDEEPVKPGATGGRGGGGGIGVKHDDLTEESDVSKK